MPAHALANVPLHGAGRSPFPFPWSRLLDALMRRICGNGVKVFSVRLDVGQELQLREAAGWMVVCRDGAVWITQEGDPRDIFLERGEGFALDRRGLALVHACSEATLSIRAPAARGDVAGARQAEHVGGVQSATEREDSADLAWMRSLYPESGPWNDPASYRRAGLL